MNTRSTWIIVCAATTAAWAPQIAATAEPIPANMGSFSDVTEVLYSSSAAQSQIVPDKPLSEIALENTRLSAKDGSFGFAAKSPEARFFLAGALCSEALALARGEKLSDALRRVEAIQHILIDLGAPSGLYTYTAKLKNHLLRGDLSAAALQDYFSLLQPLLSDFAKSQSADKATLLTTGVWVTDMGLAAGAGDTSLLRNDVMLKHVIAEMKRMDAPKGVQDALSEIAAISAQTSISERDAKTVLALVQRIQTLLG